MKKSLPANRRGFTLIELLVVISIIGILATLVINNLTDARARARDSKRKSELTQLKTALRLYYNDYQKYPTSSGGAIVGCGPNGNQICSGTIFAVGTDNSTIYMKVLPNEFTYSSSGGDSFTVKLTLENASDPEIISSQTQCPGSYGATEYVVCED